MVWFADSPFGLLELEVPPVLLRLLLLLESLALLVVLVPFDEPLGVVELLKLLLLLASGSVALAYALELSIVELLVESVSLLSV